MVCLGVPSCTMRGDWWVGLAPVQHVHMIHRGFGVVVAIVTTIAAINVYRRAKSWPQLRTPRRCIAPVLVCAQVALGIYTVLTMRSVPVAVGHFAGAASLWALWMSAWLMTGRRQTRAARTLATRRRTARGRTRRRGDHAPRADARRPSTSSRS